ncbi:sodium/bile acid cotransporter 7-like [Pseudomyrmex gracilis]|uniref:sodium/bile acid cotransporter 7-like n=1 Tax=Pseudomyrmex gracilis TaxID=219809 RepID=UPI0009955DA9|nr:sodium/bile acid cotransporter 7-like [Pseudomyrmex gracilis]XP_020299917.1 sodium/bile acid cotransporter 7-like [Pseudomyrmex gracilis]XP_020299918.1 sodium/bile acid cotransporter 7-like [Pseudomyrmex gracilis]XP_020299919.1 sodium/bile acid cotransporter 7-like [Pseudomyrmex gracilis]XP_020299920.1 sodium/bile acid cotransporter 7-like [Pseudomyrmex gracilis]
MCMNFTQFSLLPRRRNGLCQYGYVLLMLVCMLFASIQPHIGGTNGIIHGNFIIRYIAVPLIYLEAGLFCDIKSLYLTLRDGYLLTFVMTFTYILMPFLARIGTNLLRYANVNTWLLKGMEVLYCMPPPFSTGLILCRLAQADLPTSVITTLVSHFGGLFLSPVLLYIMLGISAPPLVGINLRETVFSTLVPLGAGIILRSFVLKDRFSSISTERLSQGLLLVITYHWFCDAVLTDASSLQTVDILFCVLLACIGQLLFSSLCWILCSWWLPRNILLAALFTSTHKSVGLGGWILRGAYHGSAHGPAVNLPLTILPVAQLLLGSLLASWLTPYKKFRDNSVIKQSSLLGN